jgi:hypothetical protein
MMEQQDYVIPEIVVSNRMQPREEIEPIRKMAANRMMDSLGYSAKSMRNDST